jgi:hypothetical protein
VPRLRPDRLGRCRGRADISSQVPERNCLTNAHDLKCEAVCKLSDSLATVARVKVVEQISLAEGLALGGALLQLTGFLVLSSSVVRALDVEYNDRVLMRQIKRALLGLFSKAATALEQQQVQQVPAGLGLSSSLRAKKTPESPIEKLERELAELRDTVDKETAANAEHFTVLEAHVEATRQALVSSGKKVADRLESIRSSTLHQELRGARIFILGTLLIIASVVVS